MDITSNLAGQSHLTVFGPGPGPMVVLLVTWLVINLWFGIVVAPHLARRRRPRD